MNVRIFSAPSSVATGSAVTGTLSAGGVSVYYQYPFSSNGITIFLNVGAGTVNCYASDRYQNPNEELYDWIVVVSGYQDVFIDPSLLDRPAGSSVYIGLQGVESYNTFTLNTTVGDRRSRT